MPKRTPEQNLIDLFVNHLDRQSNEDLRISLLINKNCRSKIFADVEFKSKSGLHWVIEAKSDDSKDRHNTVHKIFGELLKETGRRREEVCHYAILIPEPAIMFYSRAFQAIDRDKYIGFGSLIPIHTVFTCSRYKIEQISWEALYESYNDVEGDGEYGKADS